MRQVSIPHTCPSQSPRHSPESIANAAPVPPLQPWAALLAHYVNIVKCLCNGPHAGPCSAGRMESDKSLLGQRVEQRSL